MSLWSEHFTGVFRLSEKILIVDDSAEHRILLSRFLKTLNYESIEAENGAIALERLRSEELPRLILLDSQMDIMNGSEFLDVIASDSSGRFDAIPVIMLSGERLTHRRAARSVRKPVDLDKLTLAIHSQIEPAISI